jgi:hypothetical protein
MKRCKTYKKNRSIKRKTARRSCKHPIRRRKGGVNNNDNEFIERRAVLINTIRDIMDSIEERVQAGNDEMTFVDEIRAFEPEADLIDNHFGNNDMEDMLNGIIQEVMVIFGLVNPFFNNNNNNNNNTISIVSARRIPNSNMSNNNMI